MINQEIKKFALLFDGVKETANNSGWEKVYFPTIGMSFTQLLKTVGWHKYDAWCALDKNIG